MTASPISDLNPLLIAAGSTLTFASLDGKSPLGFSGCIERVDCHEVDGLTAHVPLF